jgi:hypothetical protein
VTGINKVYLVVAILFAMVLLAFFGLGVSHIWFVSSSLPLVSSPLPHVSSSLLFFSDLVGFSYPVFMSFKALERPSEQELQYWLVYWVVFGLIQTMESFSDTFFSWFVFVLFPVLSFGMSFFFGFLSFFLHRFPFYYFFKLCFLMWCFLPKYRVRLSFSFLLCLLFCFSFIRLSSFLFSTRAQRPFMICC